jgi:membrane-bound ClpP family serine protease
VLFAVIGLMCLARAVRARRGAGLLLAGAVLTVAGIIVPSGVIQISGMLVLLRGVAVALGVSERHRRPGGEPAGGVDVAGFRTPPWW